MKKQFVTYEIALALKELGFDGECFAYFHDKRLTGVNKWDRKVWGFHSLKLKEITNSINDIILAPLWQQAIDFLREKYCVRVVLLQRSLCTGITNKWAFYYSIYTGDGIDSSPFFSGDFNTFKISREKAVLKGIKMCQEIHNTEPK